MIEKDDAKKIENAISFLVKNIEESGHNEKPVILHSLQVAFYLLDIGKRGDIVVAAILHDLLEDSGAVKDDITKRFGQKVGDLVEAVSYDESIEDWQDRYKELFDRVKNYGEEALILKCVDLLMNSFYISKVDNKIFAEKLIDKIGYFLQISKGSIGSKKAWADLSKQYHTLRD